MKTQQDGGYTLIYVLVIVLLVSVMTVPLLNWIVNTGVQTRRDVAARQAYYAAQSGLTRISYYINQFSTLFPKGTSHDFESYMQLDLPSQASVPIVTTILPDGTRVQDTLTISWIFGSGGALTGCTVTSTGTASPKSGGGATLSDTCQMQLAFRQTAATPTNPLLDAAQASVGIIQPGTNGLTTVQFQHDFTALIPTDFNGVVEVDEKKKDITGSVNRFFQDGAHQSGDYVLEVAGADPVVGALNIPATVNLVLYFANPETVTFNNVTGSKTSQFSGMILVNGNVSSQPNPTLELNNLVVSGSVDWGQGKGQGGLVVHGTLAVGNGIAQPHDEISAEGKAFTYPYLATGSSSTGDTLLFTITRTQ